MAKPRAVCIVSGGLDSICYAASLAANDGYDLYLLTFVYGQRAKREIERARYFARLLKAKDHNVVDISFMKSLYGSSNALTDTGQKLSHDFSQSLVVPVRNAIFLTIGAAWAMSISAKVVAYGAHTGDTVHYPDCRPAFVSAINEALNIAESDAIIGGMRQEITVLSPAAIGLDKPALLKAGYKILGDKIFHTWSCYSDGIRTGKRYLHCGRCESCINRKKAFTSAQIEDKTDYATKSRGKRKGKAK
ncbi:MAG TPA: 7-cyano-7-deazaguanine synthase [Nitrososphaera sp.]|jgi:7-cyano-7-deazaguanine synthase|nr:7-cyano-7-deazaguanine synthase [Nitrososphaera sp.]